MSDREFRDKVIESLARMENQMCTLEQRSEVQAKELEAVIKFQHKALGALSVLSVVASAIISIAISSAKTAIGAGSPK